MAIKIIGKTPDRKIVKRIPCDNCGSRLEYLPIDVKEYHGTDYGGGTDGKEWIVCPKCKEQVIIRSW